MGRMKEYYYDLLEAQSADDEACEMHQLEEIYQDKIEATFQAINDLFEIELEENKKEQIINILKGA